MTTPVGTIQARFSLLLSAGTVQQQMSPTSFLAKWYVASGPTPGYVLATPAGVNVNLSQLTNPGVTWIQNADTVNYVEVGIWDPGTQEFSPLLEVWAGEIWPMRLSQYLGIDIGTGPGTHPSGTGKQLRLKGIGGSCPCIVQAFNA